MIQGEQEDYSTKLQKWEAQAELVEGMREAINEWDLLDLEFRNLESLQTYQGRVDMLGKVDAHYIKGFLSAARSKLVSYCVESKQDMRRMQTHLQEMEGQECDIICTEVITEREDIGNELPDVFYEGKRVPYLIELIHPKD